MVISEKIAICYGAVKQTRIALLGNNFCAVLVGEAKSFHIDCFLKAFIGGQYDNIYAVFCPDTNLRNVIIRFNYF